MAHFGIHFGLRVGGFASAVVAVAIVLSLGTAARAQLVASDTFNYTPGGTLSGSGGTGWSGAWTGNANTITAGLTYPGLADSASNAVTTSGSGSGSFRTLSAAQTSSDASPIYVAFLVRAVSSNFGPGTGDYAGLSLFQGTGNERFFTGAPYQTSTYGFDDQGGNVVVTGPAITPAATHLLVYRFGASRIDFYADPTPGQPLPATSTGSTNKGVITFDTIRIQAGTGANVNMSFDELRIGSSFASVAPAAVVPEPGTTVPVLAGIAVTAASALLRRRASR